MSILFVNRDPFISLDFHLAATQWCTRESAGGSPPSCDFMGAQPSGVALKL